MERHALGQTGLQVSKLGFGASPLGGVFRDVDAAEGVRAVHTAIDLGINFFDVAPFYGLTKAETALGNALKTVPRDRYILATKVGRYGGAEFDFSAERVTRSVDESLQRLQTDVIDLIQCHDIEFGSLDQVVEETIPALRKLREQGKIRYIGISGLPLQIFASVLDRTDVDTVLSYCRYTLNDTSLTTILPYLQAKKVGIINASPLAMGLLTERAVPEWHPAPAEVKAACAQAVTHCRSKGVDIAKLALQFALANPYVATTLVGMAETREVEQNAAWIAEPIDTELLSEVLAILGPVHNVTWPSGLPENN